MGVARKLAASPFLWAAMVVGVLAGPASAADPENCLLCHRYRGLSRLDAEGGRVRLFYVDPGYYDHALGAHARLKCTDCHPRDQVGVIPHQPVSPVNCTTECHLTEPGEMERVFTHQTIAGHLGNSVHSEPVLTEANRLLGEPLREGQANCLLCHDEPTFRWSGHTWTAERAHIERCSVCHTDELQVDTAYYYWHVNARSRPAWSGRDVIRTCATCHANQQVREHFNHPDTAASYLASFHGKAMLLGSEATANCLDCHVAELADPHVMKAKSDPTSPTSPQRVADTCRSEQCHPTAGAEISRASVHLDLGTSRGVEYFIGFIFFVLILLTFGPSVLITALELAQVVVGRHDPRHHEHIELAERLRRHEPARRALHRFTPGQRLQHWLLFATFTTLVLTGFPLKFADRGWAAWLVDAIGSLSRVRLLHRIAGVLLIAGFTFHIIYVIWFTWRNRKRTGKGFIGTFLQLPMVMQPSDLRQMGLLLAFLVGLRKTRPDQERFALKEKFEYFGVFWGSVLLGITGVMMWANAWTSEQLSGRVLTIAALVHTFEAFLALLHVGIIHMVGVIFGPSVFPLHPAMFTGDTPAEEMAEAHTGMLNRVAGQFPAAGGEVKHG